MIWLIWKLLTLPIRIVFGVVGLASKMIRFVGIGRIAAFGAGVGTGLALDEKTVDGLKRRLSAGTDDQPGGGDLAAVVREELAGSPRTWHLPQPDVTVVGNRVTLTGTVPHDEARLDLGRVAGAVRGVGAVDNRTSTVAPERAP